MDTCNSVSIVIPSVKPQIEGGQRWKTLLDDSSQEATVSASLSRTGGFRLLVEFFSNSPADQRRGLDSSDRRLRHTGRTDDGPTGAQVAVTQIPLRDPLLK